MHLLEFTIEGLAGRKEPYSQKLNPDVNIFFGPNGSGKTTLLKILHSALSNDAGLLNSVPFSRAQVKFYWASSKTVYTCSIERKTETPIIDETGEKGAISTTPAEEYIDSLKLLTVQQSELKWTVKPKREEPGGWRHSYLPTTRLWIGQGAQVRGYYQPNTQTEEQLDSYFQKALENLWSNYISDVLTDVRKAQEEGLANILKWILTSEQRQRKSAKTAPNVEVAYQRVSDFLARQGPQASLGSIDAFRARYAKSTLLKGVVNYIDEVEEKVERAMTPRNKLEQLIRNMFSGNKNVVFTDKSIDVLSNDKEIGVGALSSGEKHVLRILVEALYADNHVLIIDEPEISMHVDWQRDLVSSLRTISPRAQLIMATHSPEIMADLEDSKIFKI